MLCHVLEFSGAWVSLLCLQMNLQYCQSLEKYCSSSFMHHSDRIRRCSVEVFGANLSLSAIGHRPPPPQPFLCVVMPRFRPNTPPITAYMTYNVASRILCYQVRIFISARFAQTPTRPHSPPSPHRPPPPPSNSLLSNVSDIQTYFTVDILLLRLMLPPRLRRPKLFFEYIAELCAPLWWIGLVILF